MKMVIQRVKEASVAVDGETISRIGPGLLLYVGIEKGDDEATVEKMAKKLLLFRVFEDDNQKMNLSIQDVQGEILAVSQFTLAADIRKGTRPGFDTAEKPDLARQKIEFFCQILKEGGIVVREGVFGADMNVASVNDGPVTFVF